MSVPTRPDNAAERTEPQSLPESRPRAALDPKLQARLVALETERLRRERWRARLWRERRALLLLLGLVLILYANFGMARVVGQSMEPQFVSGQSLLILKSFRRLSPLRTGDMIVFHDPQNPDQEMVKRVVFIQDATRVRKWPRVVRTSRGAVPVGALFSTDVLLGARGASSDPFPLAGTIYVVGDNLENSTDSRDFGPIRDEAVLGKVLVRGLP
jgi:signal peptidase I